MKYIKHNFTDRGVRVEFEANGVYIDFFTPDTPISELPEQVQDEATNLWTQEYIDAYLESLEPSIEQWRQTTSVEMWKLEQALDDWGVLDEIEVSLLHFPMKVQRAWKKSKDARRNSPAVEGLRQHLNATYEHINLTPEDVDQIFKNAEQVEL